MTIIAMPLLVLALTGSVAKAGIVAVTRALATAAAVIPAGVISDRVDRRRLMIACSCLRLGAVSSVPIALAVGCPPFGLLVAVSLLDASLSSISYVAERSLLPVRVEGAELPEAITVNEARTAAAVLAGPPVGGVLFGLARAAPFVADASTAPLELLALATVELPGRERSAERPCETGCSGRSARASGGSSRTPS